MKRTIVGITLALLLGTAAYASNVHLKPPTSSPSFFDHGVTLSATGALAGLGMENILISMTADANVTATCTNPAGETKPPGQNPAPITATGSQAIPASEVKNGTVSFNVTTNPPTSPIPGAPGCPNSSWTEAITDLAFKDATIQVQQPPGTVVLTIECTFTPPTADGPVPRGDVSCMAF